MIRVLANGCFDCLHIGHVRYLQAAAKLGDELWVAVTIDEHVNKGPGRPVFSYDDRADMVLALQCVKAVVPAVSGLEAVTLYRPNIYAKGKDWEGRLPEADLAKHLGFKVIYIDTPKLSSTKILTGELLHERIAADRERGKQAGSVLR